MSGLSFAIWTKTGNKVSTSGFSGIPQFSRQSGELAAQLNIDHRDISRRIYRLNKRMEQEIGEIIITKRGHKWRLIPQLRHDFAVIKVEMENK